MAKSNTPKHQSIFAETIISIVMEAVKTVEGITLLSADNSKKRTGDRGIQVYFIGENKVSIDIFTNIAYGHTVPQLASAVQEKIKSEVEASTRYKVASVNVKVVSVIFDE